MSVEYAGGANCAVISQIRQAISRIETIFSHYGYIPFITHCIDGIHMVNSLHYIGAAIDFRSLGLPSQIKQAIFRDLKQNFPVPTWWMDLEDIGTSNEHYHLEYEPAKRADIDPYSVDPSDMIFSYFPSGENDLPSFPAPSFPIEKPYPQYPPGTIPPQYFTSYEQPIGWLAIVGIIIAGWLFLDLTE